MVQISAEPKFFLWLQKLLFEPPYFCTRFRISGASALPVEFPFVEEDLLVCTRVLPASSKQKRSKMWPLFVQTSPSRGIGVGSPFCDQLIWNYFFPCTCPHCSGLDQWDLFLWNSKAIRSFACQDFPLIHSTSRLLTLNSDPPVSELRFNVQTFAFHHFWI